ncbi:MAG: NAD(P)H-hydrate dehydratase, partial [Candidatus Saelkia tenebricola]|nr:NAD(P)H-hydrate dehydratase [Candidatus Saelkia tenebricola]
GKVFVLAGSLGMSGAAYLSSLAALRSGAGLVYLGIPKSLNSEAEGKITEVITVPLPETKQKTLSVKAFKKIKSILKDCDLLLIGPGLSRNISTQELVVKLVLTMKKPILLDADGINAFKSRVKLFKKRKAQSLILTPHLGEFSRLLRMPVQKIKDNRKELVSKFAEEYKLTLVLKGHNTIVASGDGKSFFNNSGNPGMATAGSGDVLSGIIVGLLGQGLTDFEAASLGVYIHGKAGDIAAWDKTELALIATDILENIPIVFKELISE